MNREIVKGLWEKRMQTAAALATLAEATRGREPTAEENTQEERMGNELVDLDEKISKGMDELEREARSADAFERYERLTAGQAQPNLPGDRSAEIADGLRGFLRGETRSWEYNLDQRVTQHYDLEKRAWNPDVWENRSLTEATANMPLPKSFSGQLYEVLVDSVGVLRAKAGTDTLFVTQSGETFTVPKFTDGSVSNVTAEGASIAAQSVDPTPGTVDLGAFKVAQIIDLSRELVEDQGFDIVGYTARAVGRAIGRKAGAFYVTGTGAGQPQGFQPNATVGVTGPSGTTVSLGTQATAGQGSDLLVDLLYSVAEPYATPGAAWMMARSSVAKVARLKGTNGEVIWMPGLAPGAPDTLLGYPIFTDPNMPAMAANARSIAFGDFNGHAVRIVRGVRFERSDEAKWDTDLVSFRGVLRTDSRLVDNTAIKVFVNSAV